MIKKKFLMIQKNMNLNLFLSLLIQKIKIKKNKKFLKLNWKKNIILKKFLKKNKIYKYKKYKLLNLKILKKKKFFCINFYNNFFDLLIWVLFIFSNKKLKLSFNKKFLKYKKKKFFINYLKYKRVKIKKLKKNIYVIGEQKQFSIKIFNYLYQASLLKYYQMFNHVLANFNLSYDKFTKYFLLSNFIKMLNIYLKNLKIKKIKKNFNFLYFMLVFIKKNKISSNLFELKKIFKKIYFIKKKNNFKVLQIYKKNFYFSKKLNMTEKLHLKNTLFLKKKKRKNRLIVKKKFIIKNRINNYFNKLIKVNLLVKKNSFKQRLFYYDFFFNNLDRTLFFLKKNNSVNFLWKKILNKTYLRFRLSEYVYNLLNEFNSFSILKSRMYYVLTFYKLIIFFKNKLKNLKKYLLRKNILRNKIKKTKKNFKYYLKKIFLIQNGLYRSFSKILIKYYFMLKYFNKLFYILLKNFSFNIKMIIEKYNKFVYLSVLINLSLQIKKYVSLVNINNYFMQKSNNALMQAWLLNDNIFNYLTIFDKTLKKDLYWNNFTPITALLEGNIEKSYIMIPSIVKNLKFQYVYFFGKKYKININYIKNITFYYLIILNFKIINFFNTNYYKDYFLFFLQSYKKKEMLNIILNLKINKNFLNKKNYLLADIIQKLLIIKNYLIFIIKFIVQKLFIYKKQNFLFRLLNWLLLFIFKQKYKFFYFNNNNYFLIYMLYKIQKCFMFYNIYNYNSKKENFFMIKNFLKKQKMLKKNMYNFKVFFLNIKMNYYTIYSKYNKYNYKKCILHLIEKKTNNFLVLSLFDIKRVIGHTSAGQGLYRAYSNTKRQKKGTWILGKIIFRKLKLRARKYALKEVFIQSNLYWNFRINFLTKYWVLRYKLGIPYLKGLKVGLGLPYHKGLRVNKRKRK